MTGVKEQDPGPSFYGNCGPALVLTDILPEATVEMFAERCGPLDWGQPSW
jgi:hypothetical protein